MTRIITTITVLLFLGCDVDCPDPNEVYENSCGACVPPGQTCATGDALPMPDMGVDAGAGDPCSGEDPVYLSFFSAQYSFGDAEPTYISAAIRSDGVGELSAQGPLLDGNFRFLVYSASDKYPEVLVHDVPVNPAFRITFSYDSQDRIDGATVRLGRLPKCEDVIDAKGLDRNRGEALLKWDQGANHLCAAPTADLDNQSNAQGLIVESTGFSGAFKMQFDYGCSPVQSRQN